MRLHFSPLSRTSTLSLSLSHSLWLSSCLFLSSVLSINCFFAFMPKIIPIFTFHVAWPRPAPPINRALPCLALSCLTLPYLALPYLDLAWLGHLINPTLYSSPPTLWSGGRQLFGNLTTIFGYANLQLSNQPRSQWARSQEPGRKAVKQPGNQAAAATQLPLWYPSFDSGTKAVS